MNSNIYNGHVEHARLTPVVHRFRTPVTFAAFDLHELAELDRTVRGFGFNRRAPVSLHSRRYLTEGGAPFADKLAPWIAECGLDTPPDRITLVTSPRFLGYVFNPVSFYLLESGGALRGLIAEVNNTFGDRHLYAMPLDRMDGIERHHHDKEFHVSPFNNSEGRYRFTVRRDDDGLYIGVDLFRGGEKVIETWIEGTGTPFTSAALRAAYLRHPLRPWLTFPRICVQAALLKFKHRLPVFPRPEPAHPHTLYSRHRPRA